MASHYNTKEKIAELETKVARLDELTQEVLGLTKALAVNALDTQKRTFRHFRIVFYAQVIVTISLLLNFVIGIFIN